MSQPKSVLFVCLGNICRSPTGEGIMQHYVVQQDANDFVRVDSAGTIGYHEGNPADPRMKKSAALRGYDLTSRSRKVTFDDFHQFDLIIAMDRDNLADLQRLKETAPETSSLAELRLLSDFLPRDDGDIGDANNDGQASSADADRWPSDVPDPYYGGPEGFEIVIDMIEAAVPGIYQHLMQVL